MQISLPARISSRLAAGLLAAVLGLQPHSAHAHQATSEQRAIGRVAYQRTSEIPFSPHAPTLRDIFAVDTDGRHLDQLTENGKSYGPSWSPDGHDIVFLFNPRQVRDNPWDPSGSDFGGAPSIYVMDSDGSHIRLLRTLRGVIWHVVWSPDASTLALDLVPEGEQGFDAGGIYLLPATGEGEPRLVVKQGHLPAWSPDAKKIAYSAHRDKERWAIYVSNADGSGEQRLTEPKVNARSPVWSPDGTRMAFVSDQEDGNQIYVSNADGSNPRRLTTKKQTMCSHPSWSPDGKDIAAQCSRAANHVQLFRAPTDIFMISADQRGAKLRQLTKDGGSDPVFRPVEAVLQNLRAPRQLTVIPSEEPLRTKSSTP